MLYTIGYTGISAQDLKNAAIANDWQIVDIRFTPASRNPVWSRLRLTELMGERYTHLKELGNVNYKNGGPIQLVNPASGAAVIRGYLLVRPVVLMCVCADVETCHRKNAAEYLAEALGETITHLTPVDLRASLPTPPPPPIQQLKLF